jgi:pimeloyl-ACP methyl ester carboxylesterase
MMSTLISRDGTRIAYERTGAGPALIAVDPAGSYRAFRPMRPPVEALAADFTVYQYDRRGRGESTDTPPYAVEREVEDIAALIAAAGGTAYLYGMSSGGLLALYAAASGLPVARIALLEPPYVAGASGPSPYTTELARLVAAGRRREAVDYFHRTVVGVPEEILAQMPPETWTVLEAVAPTLVYDGVLSDGATPALLKAVPVPTLVIDSAGSTDDLTGMAATVAGDLPFGTHRSLAGGWHGVPDEVLAPALREFFLSSS